MCICVCPYKCVCVYLAEWGLVGPSSLPRMTAVLRYFVLEYVCFYDQQDKGSRSHGNWYQESRH
jgi:hypothetical protein